MATDIAFAMAVFGEASRRPCPNGTGACYMQVCPLICSCLRAHMFVVHVTA